jgi:hypothetical protein
VYIINNNIINKRENLNDCEIVNCGEIKDENKCLKCDNCGVYTDIRNYKYCTNGNKNGPLFLENWKIWKYMDNEPLYKINSPNIKLYDEYTKYLDQLDKIIQKTPQPRYNIIM